MGAEIIGRQDQQDVTGEISKHDEEAVLANSLALEVAHDEHLDQQGDNKGGRQPVDWVALEQDQEDGVEDTRDEIHDQRYGQGLAKWIPSEQGEGNTFDEGDDNVDHEQGEETKDKQEDG